MLLTHKLFFLAASLCGFASCGQQTFDEKMTSLYDHTVPLIHENELKAIQPTVYILDIRSKKEFDISHIEGAHFIDYESFEASDVAGIPKDTTIVVYCSVGYRSEQVGERLIDMGYTDVKNLYGGIFDWKNKGNIIVNNQHSPTDSVHAYNENWSQWLYNGIKVYE